MSRARSHIATFLLLAATSAAHAATPIDDAKLRGDAQVPATASLTVKTGATLIVDPGAALTGLVRDLNNPTLTGNITISGGGTLSVQVPATFTYPVTIGTGATLTAGTATFTGLTVTPNATTLSALIVGGAFTANSTAALKSTLSVTGAATLSSTLSVGGTSTFTGRTTHNGGSYTYGTNFHYGTDYFASNAYLQGGSYTAADNSAQLRGIARAPRYAVFEIPLGIYGAQWTDFELKGSVNNFEGLAEQALVYFYGSAYGSGSSTHSAIGTTKAVYFTDTLGGSDHGAARKWRKQTPSFSIFQQKSYNGVVGGIIVVVPVDGTINPHNDRLQFIYQRVSASQTEEIWVPIIPRWLVTDPRPIDQPPASDNKPSPPPYWLDE